jgi:hypothetical protein
MKDNAINCFRTESTIRNCLKISAPAGIARYFPLQHALKRNEPMKFKTPGRGRVSRENHHKKVLSDLDQVISMAFGNVFPMLRHSAGGSWSIEVVT